MNSSSRCRYRKGTARADEESDSTRPFRVPGSPSIIHVARSLVLTYLASLWDVLYGLRGLRPVDHWVRAYDGFGVTLAVNEINARSRDWIRRALADSRT
jgi:hypothetical protein